MKILHLLRTDRYSGAENVVCQIIEMFKADSGFQMVYCSPDGPIRAVLERRNIPFAALDGFSAAQVRKAIKKGKPDLIHAHDFRASVMAALVCGKTPVISHLHNNSPWIRQYGRRSFTYGATCWRYKAILTVSGSVFDEFVFGNKFRDKLAIVGNPVNVREIQARATKGGNEKLYDLGFCGRFTPPKKPEGFIAITDSLHKRLPDLKAAMVGTGEQLEEMKELIRQKGLEDVITLYGFQENPYDIMKSFKILCMPSRWEGFGLVAVEALALGVPVVCSNVGGLPGIVNDECGKVCRSEEEMDRECFDLLTDENTYARKSAKALERAWQQDNTVKYKNRLTGIYKGHTDET